MDFGNPAVWLLGGGSIFGILMSCWRQIQGLFWQAVNLVFSSVKFVGTPTTQVAVFLAEEGTEFPVSIRTVGSKNYFLQAENRNRTALCDLVPEQGKLILWRKVPIYITRGHSDAYGTQGDDYTNGKATGAQYCSITFLRGTLNVTDFLREYEKWLNTQTEERRFTIKHYYGRGDYSGRHPDDQLSNSRAIATDREGSVAAGDGKLIFEQEYLSIETKRVFDILWLAPQVQELVREAKHWHRSKKWYEDRCIPWKRGYLLTGEPGTGKSSLVRAIAEELDIPIFSIHMGGMNPYAFKNIWTNASKETPCIVLLEDFDNVYNGREAIDHEIPFDNLLNMLDGVDRTDGILTFITTNHPEKIDEALAGGGKATRPGRIDLVVDLPRLDAEGRLKVASRILPPELVELAVLQGANDTGAQFQNRCTVMALEQHFNSLDNLA